MSPVQLGWYRLEFPLGLEPDPVVRFLRLLATRRRGSLRAGPAPVAFEIHAGHRRLSWWLGVDRSARRLMLDGLRSQLGGVQVLGDEEFTRPSVMEGVELSVESAFRPLRLDIAEETAAGLLDAMSHLGSGEAVVVQWLVGPPLPRPVVPSGGSSPAPRTIWNLPDWGRPSFDSEGARQLRKKQTEPLLGLVGRVAVGAGEPRRRRQLIQTVVGAWQLVREPGAGLATRGLVAKRSVPGRLVRLQAPKVGWPVVLSVAELAVVLGWPIGNPELPGVRYAGHRLLAPDERTLVPVEQAGQRRILAESADPARPGLVALSATAAVQHLHVLGPTGSGKSWLLANLALSDLAAGFGVVVVDPKGSLVDDLLTRVPEDRLADVVVLDPADASPVGLNPLAEGPAAVDGLLHVMRALWAGSWGPRLEDILHAGLLTLARAGGHSLAELPLLFTDAAFRRPLVGAAHRSDPLGTGSFWNWYESLSEEHRAQVLAPVMNKLRAFLLRPELRAVLGQVEPRFRLEQVFREHKALLVRLPAGSLGPDGAALVGSLVVSQLWQAIQRRGASGGRRPAFVYLDEFQDFLRLPLDLGDALAKARGHGVGLVLAHQHLGQADPAVRAAALSNAGNRLLFGLDYDDATVMARRSGGQLTAEDFRRLPAFEAYASVMVDGTRTAPASVRTRPLGPPVRSVAEVLATNRRRWGIAADDTEEHLRGLVEKPGPGRPEGPLGAQPSPGGQR